MEEFGIIDLYIPEMGTSNSGFYIVSGQNNANP